MDNYVVYHSTDAEYNEGHSLVNDSSTSYDFDIYTKKSVHCLINNTVWIIEGIRESSQKRKIYYLAERFIVNGIGEKWDRNWAYGQIGERYIFAHRIKLNNLPWFSDFQHRMANFSLGLSKLKDSDLKCFVAEIKKRGYPEHLGGRKGGRSSHLVPGAQ